MTFCAPFPRLRDGDRVAVVAPASRPERRRVEAGLAVLRGWGLEPVLLPSVTGRHPRIGHLAGSDEVRAHDIETAWRDDAVRAIWCARGGYGSQRLLDLLTPGLFGRGRPKPIIGFSDATPLLHRAAAESGTQMIHGPALVTLGEAPPEALEHLHDLLWARPDPRTLLTHLHPWRDGDVSGPLLGGNVALLAASIGTTDLPDAQGAVILLEDVGQEHWVLDRNLTQLLRSGWLSDAAGIVLGDFSVDDPELVQEVLRDRLLPLGIPVWANAPVGHERVNLALPIGANVRVLASYLRLA